MSDGSLSQEEIDALLQGVPSFGGKQPESKKSPAAEADSRLKNSFAAIPEKIKDTYAANLETLTSVPVSVKNMQIDEVNAESILTKLPDEVVYFNASFSGCEKNSHVYLFSKETAKVVAEKMMGQTLDDISDATVSAIGEAINLLNSAVVTEMESEGISLNPEPLAGNLNLSGSIGLPSGKFLLITYDLKINGFDNGKLYEFYSASTAEKMLGKTAAASAGSQKSSLEDMLKMNTQPTPASGMNFNQQPSSPSNQTGAVQPAVFSGLTDVSGLSPAEQSNISLLMDVFMEMTVELGRTKRLIKDILQMGEGTIIALDKLAGEPVDILVNHKLIAKGEVVVIDENFGVRVTEIISPMERVSDII